MRNPRRSALSSERRSSLRTATERHTSEAGNGEWKNSPIWEGSEGACTTGESSYCSYGDGLTGECWWAKNNVAIAESSQHRRMASPWPCVACARCTTGAA
eukprot:scaffold1900_cov32-Tisochrysis_lutea.AAC.6